MTAWLLLVLLTGSVSAEAAVPTTTGGNPISEEVLRLRDPFKRPDLDTGKLIVRTEIEKYPVDSFRMVAVLTGPTRMRAMVLAPDNKTYMVHAGMKIGVRQGVIKRITEDGIEVRERIVNVLGQEENLDIEIPLVPDSKLGPAGGRR